MFVLSFAAPAAFAADTTTTTTTTTTTETTTAATKVIGKDVKGTKYEKAAAKLIALGIVNGFEDGSIKPETEVTRAQFAAIIAKELKLGDGVPSATKFKDVPASHWASGVINLAVGKGIIHGYPNGTFKPDAPVTYAEAAAMLVQTLGYGPALKGTPWPAGVLSMAGSSGISKGVSLNPSGKALRGDVIIMAANALTADIMKQTVWGTDQYWQKEDNTNLLEEVFNLNVYDKDTATKDEEYNNEMPVVDKVARFDLSNLDSNEVEFSGNNELSGTFKVVGKNIDPNVFMGQEVEVWADPDAKEVYYIGNSKNETVVYDKVKEFVTENGKEKIKLDISGDKYEVLDDAKVYYNISSDDKVYSALTNLPALKGANVKLVLNDDEQVTAMVIDDFYGVDSDDFNDQAVIAGFVKKVNTDDETIEYYNSSTSDKQELEDADYVVIRDGFTAELKDIKANDVINIFKTDDDEKAYIFATSATAKGKVEKVVTSNRDDVSAFDITIAGKKYDCAEKVTYSEDDNKSVSLADGSDLFDFDGQEVTAYLDAQGNIKHISSGKLADSGKLYGVVTKEAKYNSYDDEVKFTIVNKSGSTVNFTFDPSDVELNGTKYDDGSVWVDELDLDGADDNLVVVEYKLDSAGKLSKVWVRNDEFDYDTDDPDDVADTFGDYNIEDSTIIFDFTGNFVPETNDADNAEKKDVKVIKWADVEKKDSVDAYYKVDDDHLDYLIVVDCDGTLGAGAEYGVVTGLTSIGGDDAVEILTASGEKKIYNFEDAEVDGYLVNGTRSSTSNVKKGDFVRYEVDTNGEISELTVLAYKDDMPDVTSINNAIDALGLDSAKLGVVNETTSRSITVYTTGQDGTTDINTTRNIPINDKTAIYEIFDTTALKKVTSVSAGDLVLAVDTDDDGSVADVVVVIAENYVPLYVAAPNVTANDETNKIVGANSDMEYFIDGGTTWEDDITTATFDGDLTVKVRYKAGFRKNWPASEVTDLTFTAP